MSEREFVQQLGEREIAALVEVMFLAAVADGELEQVEAGELSQSIARVTGGAVDSAKAGTLVAAARAALAGSNRLARLQVVRAALSPGQRKHALLLGIQVTASDGRIRTSERELILEAAEALEIDGDTAADLVNIVEGSSRE